MDDLSIVLNDLRFNYRMWKRRQRQFIDDLLLKVDVETLIEIRDENEKAFRNGENIKVAERVGDKFQTREVSSQDENYTEMYNLQVVRFKNWINAGKMIQDYIRTNDVETEALMSEVYESVNSGGIKFASPRLKDNREITTAAVKNKGEEISESEREIVLEEVNNQGEVSSDVSEAEELIQSLSAKADEFDKKFKIEEVARDERVSFDSLNEYFFFDAVISEVDFYYDKLEKLKERQDILDFYEDNMEYIEDDLGIDIEYLESRLSSYQKLYEQKEPISFVVADECKCFKAEDNNYDMAFNYICTKIEITIEKGKTIRDKNFVHDSLTEPVRDFVMEMMFDEIDYYTHKCNEILKAGDSSDVSMAIVWTDSSIRILNRLKDRLEEDYNNGHKIKVAKLENGRYVVTEENNTLENYQKQLEFLEENILLCINLKDRLNEMKDYQEFRSDSDVDIDSKYVVVLNEGKLFIIGTDLDEDDLDKMKSDLLREAKDKGMDVELALNLGSGLQNVGGLLLDVGEDGTITLGGNIEKAEFHNQEELIRTYDNIEEPDVISRLMELKDEDNIAEIRTIMKDNPGIVWSKLANKVNSGEVSEDDAKNFVRYILDNYGADDLRGDAIIVNVGYQSLLKLLKMSEISPLETDVTKIRKPVDAMEARNARKLVSRRKNFDLINKFKKLKKWQKVAIVAGLTIAGVAVVGAGVYHLIPEVRPMIDGFIQNLHIPNFGREASSALPQANPGISAEVTTQAAPSVSDLSVDYSSFGTGHRVFTDAYNAVSGVNPLEANGWFNNNPLDVFNIDTNQFMHLTSEQLRDPEFLKNLASDPNNTMLFGSDMAHPDGFVPLSDIVREAIKGGKVL